MSRELWEIVQVYNVNVGDVIIVNTYGHPATIAEGQIDKYGGIPSLNLHCEETVFRRVPDHENPRVLKRALLLMEESWLQGRGLRNWKGYVEDARKELESEAGK